MDPSEDVMRRMLMAAPDALLAVKGDGEIVFANTYAELLFGWTNDELVGEKVELLVPGAAFDDYVAHRAGFVADPRTRPFGAGMQLSARRKDGDTFPAEISLNDVSDDLGERVVLAAVRDISDRIELEADRQRRELLAQQERSGRFESLGQLAGGIAHDFNNVLGVILNYATLLGRRITDPMDAADLQEIHSAAERARELTRKLTSFASRDVTDPQPLEVNSVVRQTMSTLEETFDESIEIELDLAPDTLMTVADRQQLEQIIVNLAVNARDALPDGGCLTITTAPLRSLPPHGDGGQLHTDVVLRVVDDGIGMPPEVLRRAFEPFFSTKPRGQGAGLGLASVHGIVLQNDGSVTIDSTAEEGTTVTVVLPGIEDVAPVVDPRAFEKVPDG